MADNSIQNKDLDRMLKNDASKEGWDLEDIESLPIDSDGSFDIFSDAEGFDSEGNDTASMDSQWEGNEDLQSNDDLMSLLNMDLDSMEQTDSNTENNPISIDTTPESSESQTQDSLDSPEDILSLLDNDVDSAVQHPQDMQESQTEDILSLDSISSDDEANSDIGSVFSDALSAVSSLDDKADKQEEIEPDTKDLKKRKKRKKAEDKQEEKKTSIWKRLFSNIKETPEQTEKRLKKEKKDSEIEEQKAAKKAAEAEEGGKAKEEAKLEKKAAKETKAKLKQEAKAAKQKLKEEKKAEEAEEAAKEAGSKINKIGAAIIFVFFGVVVSIIIIGTNTFSYAQSIQNADENFTRKHFNEAYENIYGLNVKPADMELQDKIMTVMYVNKQLNSYHNYLGMQKEPEALDSLLKGLKRYDKYIEHAKELGIESDLEYVRNQIMEELNQTFDLTKQQIEDILKLEDQTAYSIAVYNVVLEQPNS